MIDDLERLGFVEVMDVSPFEKFYVNIKRTYKIACELRNLRMVEAVVVMDSKRI